MVVILLLVQANALFYKLMMDEKEKITVPFFVKI